MKYKFIDNYQILRILNSNIESRSRLTERKTIEWINVEEENRKMMKNKY